MCMASLQTNVCAVMVTFHPDEGWQARLEAVLPQVAHLVVVDNSTDEAARASVRTVCAGYGERVTYLQSPSNNLALAQNIGIRHALAMPVTTHVLLLDDDSTPENGMVATLLAHDTPPIGLLAPAMADASDRTTRYVVAGRGLPALKTAPQDGVLNEVLHAIASGSLIARRAFEVAGMMDERMVIDYIDKEFCLRLRRKGLGIRVVGAAKLAHRIGQSCGHSLAGLRITATNHPPARRYTIYRNRILCLRRYGLSEPAFLLHEIGGIAYDWLRIATCESDRREKFRAILRGIKDGLCTPGL